MKTSSFSFDLPKHLVAQYPSGQREMSRLMQLDPSKQEITHHMFQDIVGLIPEGTLLVMNNSRVRKARIPGMKESGGTEAEFLFIEETEPDVWNALVKKSRSYKKGTTVVFPGDRTAEVSGHLEGKLLLRFNLPLEESYFETYGKVPLPPYIDRPTVLSDSQRYQTVYADAPGSVAAPTAGLHFTPAILEKLAERGITQAFVTLHVGLGTFLPVRTEHIEDHTMHEETYTVSELTAVMLNNALGKKLQICAVGTTSIRTLESAVHTDEQGNSMFKAGTFKTSIFIYPGYRFRVADMLLTNFHTPESSLLMLVSAFAGTDFIKKAYAEAVKKEYRFFSYGDAMFIRCRKK
ncbi:MAG: tRNA preQ1(34) S-adenosylmethionine ribosyltransferase-isomerase QueA [Spirochaetales bacterium]|nr:tRNA preQ1(34) S-adenosylmethionine ribosyltransferase-isomerase QueA [Spirochaetales bacterium]